MDERTQSSLSYFTQCKSYIPLKVHQLTQIFDLITYDDYLTIKDNIVTKEQCLFFIGLYPREDRQAMKVT